MNTMLPTSLYLALSRYAAESADDVGEPVALAYEVMADEPSLVADAMNAAGYRCSDAQVVAFATSYRLYSGSVH